MENSIKDKQPLILNYIGNNLLSGPIYEVNDSEKYVADLGGEHSISNLHWLSPSNDMDGEPAFSLDLANIKEIKVYSKQGLVLPENIQRFAFEFNVDKEGLEKFEKELEEKAKASEKTVKESFEKYVKDVADKEYLKVIIYGDVCFRYQFLSRLKTDCEYYLGAGNRYSGHLLAKAEKEQITYMKAIWESFLEGEKPEWISWEQIMKYEKEMVREKPLLKDQITDASKIVEEKINFVNSLKKEVKQQDKKTALERV